MNVDSGVPRREDPVCPAGELESTRAAAVNNTLDSEWFRAVADNTYDWESWHDPGGRLVWVNPAVERMTGRTVTECLAMPGYPLPLVLDEDRGSVARAIADAQREVPGEHVEFRLRHRSSGDVRWMSLCWQPMYSTTGQHLGFRTSIRDITERQHLREQLRLHADHLEQLVEQRTSRLQQLERRSRQMEKLAALGQLAAGVAHEINNPLAGIRNAFELIKVGLSPTHRHFELLELIDREIERVSGIVHQMYQLYRRHPQPASDFDLNRTVEEVVYLLEPVADKHHVQLRCDLASGTMAVKLPEGEVKQILYNLVRNAIQASPAGGEVVVRVQADANETTVQVRDMGPGISDDLLPHIFDPFFSTKHADAQAGMGLGLSVSRSLIEAMGGRIEVQSSAGLGSEFFACFPKCETPGDRADE